MADKSRKQKEDLKREDILQAVFIVDNFERKFGPLSINQPGHTCLMPLVNKPLIDYTLEFLVDAGIKQLFVICCDQVDDIKKHVRKSKWCSPSSPCLIEVVSADSCLSVGDVLREMDKKSLVRSDFLLVTENVVSNMDLKAAMELHKARRKKDNLSEITMILKEALPRHRSRHDNTLVAIDEVSNRVFYWQKVTANNKISLPLTGFEEADALEIRYDLMDCQVCICSTRIPQLFTDNFDYQNMDDFVHGFLVNEEIQGRKMYAHILVDEYAAKVSNSQMYTAVSMDILTRWVYPFVADLQCTDDDHENMYVYRRHNVYVKRKDVCLARNCELTANVVIGKGSSVGGRSRISNSVIGKNCVIGAKCQLDGALLWDDVHLEDGCVLTECVLASDVKLYTGSTIRPGCVLGAKVRVGPNIDLKEGTQMSDEPLLLEDSFDDDFDETSLASEDGGAKEKSSLLVCDEALVGTKGHGFILEPFNEEDVEESGDVSGRNFRMEVLSSDSDSRRSDDEDGSFGDAGYDDDEDGDDVENETSLLPEDVKLFYLEILDSLQRGIDEKVKCDNLVLEVNSSKYAYNVTIKEVSQCLTKAMFAIADSQSAVDYFSCLKSLMQRHLPLFKNYVKNRESQNDVITILEEECLQRLNKNSNPLQLFHLLYHEDLIAEEVIVEWHEQVVLERKGDERKKLKDMLLPLIRWFEEAEEESD